MRTVRPNVSLFLSLVLVLSSSAQQTSTTNVVQPSTLLQSGLAALAGSNKVTDITLTGSAERIAGSDDETGTATLQAISGASLLNLSFPSGARSETRNVTGLTLAGSWSGPDGISHAISYHNLLTEPVWFFPTFSVANGLSCSTCIITYVGLGTWNGLAVQHFIIVQILSLASATDPFLQHLGQVDLYLDASSFLPLAFDFNVHPDNDASLDIPVEIRFSNYQAVNGVQVPFHVQKFLNNGLILDLQFQSAVLNSGLSATIFAVAQQQ